MTDDSRSELPGAVNQSSASTRQDDAAVRESAIEQCALVAEGFDAACDSDRMKLFVEAGLVMAIYKRDGEIGAAIRALKSEPPPSPDAMASREAIIEECAKQLEDTARNYGGSDGMGVGATAGVYHGNHIHNILATEATRLRALTARAKP